MGDKGEKIKITKEQNNILLITPPAFSKEIHN